MKIIFISVCLSLFCNLNVNAQIKGLVQGSDSTTKKPLFNAKIKLLNAKTGVLTSEEGTFEIVLPKNLPDTLVITAMGYHSDSIIVRKNDRFVSLNIVLYSENLLPEIIVEYRKSTHGISRMKTLHVEELTSGELRKAACCNLSESFETNASVDVSITDAVSGAKKIQMMGLDGVYTQIQMENIPYLRGLESSFGLQSISGTWIESIQITKGTGNVVNGYESMAGLVNLEIKKPKEMEKFFANVYQNIFGRSEVNLNSGQIINDKWSTGTLAHASKVYGNIDHNHDGFRDLPMGDNIAFMNRWDYGGKNKEIQFGINAYQDRKVGGQTTFYRGLGIEPNPNSSYGVILNSKHIDIFAKTGFFGKKPMQSLGIVYNLKYQDMNGQFGIRPFSGIEKRAYINAIYDDIISTSDHKIKVGMSLVALNIFQKADSLSENRNEIVPGIFSEYTFTGSRFTGVIGARYDYHNLFGSQFSPRIHAKYTLSEKTDLRLTTGKGWRVPNYMIDNISLLANSKQWIAPLNTQPEISWNFGGSIVQEFTLFNQKANITFDFYHTLFRNQLVVDRDVSLNTIVFSNLKNSSFSNSFQTELSFSPIKNFDVRFAFKILDVKAKYGGEIRQQVMIPRQRGFINLAYKSRDKRWFFDFTCSVFGSSRLPVQVDPSNPSNEIFDTKSKIYPMINSQITHVYKKWEFYLGGENLLNFKQQNPIVDAQNPFSTKFDATNIWGPIMGINIYTGVRFSIIKKK
ncbi:MAG: TonB-dependent receptor [Flavobacteriales bacterium]|nr:TonB-dependent receptor [Flavobacteriales bacterium]